MSQQILNAEEIAERKIKREELRLSHLKPYQCGDGQVRMLDPRLVPGEPEYEEEQRQDRIEEVMREIRKVIEGKIQ